MKSLDLRAKLIGLKKNKIAFGLLENGNIVIAYNTASNVNILIMDQQGDIVKQKNNAIAANNSNYTTQLFASKCSIFLYSQTSKSSSNTHSNSYYDDETYRIESFNENLDGKSSIFLSAAFKFFTADETHLFGLSLQNGASSTLSVYDKNLQFTKTIGQNKSSLPHYFPSSISDIKVNKEFFFLLNSNTEIKLMNRNDGLVLKTLQINATDFHLISNEYILTYDAPSKTLCSYDFDGNKDAEQRFDKLPLKNQLVTVSNEKAIFYDTTQMALNF
jgi:hypothetical protein